MDANKNTGDTIVNVDLSLDEVSLISQMCDKIPVTGMKSMSILLRLNAKIVMVVQKLDAASAESSNAGEEESV